MTVVVNKVKKNDEKPKSEKKETAVKSDKKDKK